MANQPYFEGTRQYVGARYVPKFADPIEWNPNMTYEPLTVITWMKSSYTSKKDVPAGIEPTNSEYWALTGAYSAQIDGYHEEVEQVKQQMSDLDDKVQQDIAGALDSVNNTENTIRNDVATSIQENRDYVNTAITNNNDTIDQTVTDLRSEVNTAIDSVKEEVGSTVDDVYRALDGSVGWNFLANKTLYIYGDSISDQSHTQNNWVAELKKIVPPTTTIVNHAKSGATLAKTNASNCIATIIQETISSDADVVLIFGGTNDYRRGVRFGRTTDGLSTVAGAINNMVDNIKRLATNAVVFLMSPLATYIDADNPPYPGFDPSIPAVVYRTGMRSIAAVANWKYIDGIGAPMLSPYVDEYKAKYIPDGVHPNENYSPILCSYIYNCLAGNRGSDIPYTVYRVNISKYCESSVTNNSGYMHIFEDGCCEIYLTGTVSVNANTVTKIATLPQDLGVNTYWAMPCVGTIAGAVVHGSCSFNSNIVNISASASGNFTFSINYRAHLRDVYYKHIGD